MLLGRYVEAFFVQHASEGDKHAIQPFVDGNWLSAESLRFNP